MLSLVLIFLFSSIVLAETYVLPSLREIYKDYFDLGVAVSIAGWSSRTIDSHRELFIPHFSSLTAENEMKPEALQPREGSFNFSDSNKLMALAKENNMKVRGHTLVWHAQTPDWFFKDKDGNLIYDKKDITDEDRQLVIQRLEDHIEGVLDYFGDSVYVWDVVNETVSDDGNYIHRPNSPWYRVLGNDFMNVAFNKAHEVNPNIKLFYNDYNAEMVYKRGRTLSMLRDLINDGVPIHGIGIQGHWGVNGPSITEIEDAIKMYANLGLEVHFTELDIGLDDKTLEEQAERFREVFKLFKKYKGVVTSVTLWGVADDASWRPDDYPLLFDEEHQPKPAFWAIVDTDQPWDVTRAQYTGAAVLKDESGKIIATLSSGDYDFDALDFELEDVSQIQTAKDHLITFYEEKSLQGKPLYYLSGQEFDGREMAQKVKSFSISHAEAENLALDKPVEANADQARAIRAVDGNRMTNWNPTGTPPFWVSVDLEDYYLLNRWVVRLRGAGPLAGGAANSPFNAADFELQISDDGINWQAIDTLEGNTASVVDRNLNLVRARYVRLYVTKPSSLDANSGLIVYELELFGLPD